MKNNIEVLEFDEKLYDEFERLCKGVNSLSGDLVEVSFTNGSTAKMVNIVVVQSILLRNSMNSLKEIQQYRKDEGFITHKISEDVLEHQINSLAETCDLIGNSFDNIITMLEMTFDSNMKMRGKVVQLINDQALQTFTTKIKMSKKQKTAKLHALAETEREPYI